MLFRGIVETELPFVRYIVLKTERESHHMCGERFGRLALRKITAVYFTFKIGS